jgi:hypothetical protein
VTLRGGLSKHNWGHSRESLENCSQEADKWSQQGATNWVGPIN